MSKKRRRYQEVSRAIALPSQIDAIEHARSYLAHLGILSQPSLSSSSSSYSVSRLDRNRVERRPLPVRSTGERLRSSPFSISSTYLSKMPHGTARQAVSCVKTHLKQMRNNQGSGKASRSFKNRQSQRRQIFQAARKTC